MKQDLMLMLVVAFLLGLFFKQITGQVCGCELVEGVDNCSPDPCHPNGLCGAGLFFDGEEYGYRCTCNEGWEWDKNGADKSNCNKNKKKDTETVAGLGESGENKRDPCPPCCGDCWDSDLCKHPAWGVSEWGNNGPMPTQTCYEQMFG